MSHFNRRTWNILNWKLEGINLDDKCNTVRAKIEEGSCAIVCLQETKRQDFTPSDVRKLAPKRFNKFAFVPSHGASGGIFIGYNGTLFSGSVISSRDFAITIPFSSLHNAEQWYLIAVYGPCGGQQRHDFVDWLILYTYLMMKTGCSLVISTSIHLTKIEAEKGDVCRTS
jgi:exonuclease III